MARMRTTTDARRDMRTRMSGIEKSSGSLGLQGATRALAGMVAAERDFVLPEEKQRMLKRRGR